MPIELRKPHWQLTSSPLLKGTTLWTPPPPEAKGSGEVVKVGEAKEEVGLEEVAVVEEVSWEGEGASVEGTAFSEGEASGEELGEELGEEFIINNTYLSTHKQFFY
jgi:hypothetical protein